MVQVWKAEKNSNCFSSLFFQKQQKKKFSTVFPFSKTAEKKFSTVFPFSKTAEKKFSTVFPFSKTAEKKIFFFHSFHVVCPSPARWRTLPINSLPVSLLGTGHCMPLYAGALIRSPMSGRKSQVSRLTQLFYPGGISGSEGGPNPRYLFCGRNGLFKTSACPRFCKWRVLFCTQERSMGGQNPLTIHEIYAALTPSDSRSDVCSQRAWASESAAAPS